MCDVSPPLRYPRGLPSRSPPPACPRAPNHQSACRLPGFAELESEDWPFSVVCASDSCVSSRRGLVVCSFSGPSSIPLPARPTVLSPCTSQGASRPSQGLAVRPEAAVCGPGRGLCADTGSAPLVSTEEHGGGVAGKSLSGRVGGHRSDCGVADQLRGCVSSSSSLALGDAGVIPAAGGWWLFVAFIPVPDGRGGGASLCVSFAFLRLGRGVCSDPLPADGVRFPVGDP